MTKIKAFARNYIFLFVPLIVTVFCCLTGITRYLVFDDITMLQMAESFQTNAHSEQLMFMSVLLGYFMRFLYLFAPSICWFTVTELFVLTFAFTLLHAVARKYNYHWLFVSLLLVMQMYLLTNLTFTNIAFICATASLAFALNYLDKKRKQNIICFFIAVLGCFLAFSMRASSSMPMVILLLLFPTLCLFVYKSDAKKRTVLTVLVLIGIVALSFYIVKFSAKTYNESIPAELYFRQFQAYRSAANDAEVFNYQEHLDYYQSLGISETNFNMFTKWFMGDSNVFSAEFAKAVAESRTFTERVDINPISILTHIFSSKLLVVFIVAYTAIGLFVFIACSTKEYKIAAAGTYLMALAAIGSLFVIRRGLFRVCAVLILCGIILLSCIYYACKESGGLHKRLDPIFPSKLYKLIPILCLAFIVLVAGYFVYRDYRMERNVATQETVVEYLNENSDETVYLTEVWTFDELAIEEHSNHLFQANMQLPYYVIDTNYDIYSYYWYDELSNIGLEKYSDAVLFALLDDSVNAVLSDTDPDMFVTFFKENYNMDVQYRMIKNFNDELFIYDFNSVQSLEE